MRNRITVLIILLFLLSCKNGKKNNDLSWQKIKGSVSNVEELVYSPLEKFGEIQKGSLKWKFVYRYDKTGNMIERDYYHTDGNLKTKFIYKFDEKQNNIEESLYTGDGKISNKKISIYDSKGNKTETVFYNAEGVATGKWIYNNSTDSRTVEITIVFSNSQSLKTVNKYDEKKRLIEELSYDANGNIESRTVSKYDEKGNILERNYLNSNGESNVLSTSSYDVDGNVLKSETIYKGGSLTRSEYKYENIDKEGNWLRSFNVQDGKTEELIERIIEYY